MIRERGKCPVSDLCGLLFVFDSGNIPGLRSVSVAVNGIIFVNLPSVLLRFTVGRTVFSGLTGFDSGQSRKVSMPSIVWMAR